jgi:hypothetical protein
MRELLPDPAGPVNPTVLTLPVLVNISRIIVCESGSQLSTMEMALARERLSPSRRPLTTANIVICYYGISIICLLMSGHMFKELL